MEAPALLGAEARVPHNSQAVFLDHVLDMPLRYNFNTGAPATVADASDAPLLVDRNYVHVYTVPADVPIEMSSGQAILPRTPAGTKIWATYCTEEHLDDGWLTGANVRRIDADSDGTYESILQ